MSTEIIKSETENNFGSPSNFEHAQRVAKMLSSSTLVPKEYQGNIQNTMIAMEMANRIGASPLMVMQNLYVINGRPSWSSTFIIASLNACNRFSPLRFEMTGEGKEYGCYAWAYDQQTKDKLIGPKITWQMVEDEGWKSKGGSKWKTMPELMFRYRAAAFFGRLYAPDIMMGMHSQEEIYDVQPLTPQDQKLSKEQERVMYMIQDAETIEDLMKLEPMLTDANKEQYEEKFGLLSEKELTVKP